MLKLFFIIGLGGAIGSYLRYLTALLFAKYFMAAFPYATLTVNVVGCFIIGLVYTLSERFHFLSADWRLFLITGFCGGLTTFSTFAYENIKLIQEGNTMLFLMYSFGSFGLGLLAVLAGINMFKLFN
ncbi:MAG: fluoride efflux transporter CrcB [Chitinophagaceae bacterium]